MTRLQKLVAFASICSEEDTASEWSSFTSLSDFDGSGIFKDSLQSLAKNSLLTVETLQHSLVLSTTPRKWITEKGPIKYNKKVLTQWPTNCSEYQMYLREMLERRREKAKSSLRLMETPVEEKRVRFDVTSTSSDCLDTNDSLQD